MIPVKDSSFRYRHLPFSVCLCLCLSVSLSVCLSVYVYVCTVLDYLFILRTRKSDGLLIYFRYMMILMPKIPKTTGKRGPWPGPNAQRGPQSSIATTSVNVCSLLCFLRCFHPSLSSSVYRCPRAQRKCSSFSGW